MALAGLGQAIAQNAPVSEPPPPDTKPAEPWSLSLDYTGALFGYYRVEPDERWLADLGPPNGFLKGINSMRPDEGPQRLLLGMGDNFGPEFGASVERELEQHREDATDNPCYLPGPALKKNAPSHKKDAPEGLYKTSQRLPMMAECDNVARFLMLAGYRAIVPGKEDFLYSAVWLRRIALALQTASGVAKNPEYPERLEVKHDSADETGLLNHTPDHQLVLLAANLRWNSSSKNCPLMFSWNSPADDSEKCVPGDDRGNTVTENMDWVRRLDVTLESHCGPNRHAPECFPLESSMNMRSRSDVTFRRQLLENQASITAAALRGEAQGSVKEILTRVQKLTKDDAFEKLAGKNPQLTLTSEAKNNLRELGALLKSCPNPAADNDLDVVLCALNDRFKLMSRDDVDFLLPREARKAAVRLLLRNIANEQKNVGYTTVKEGAMARTLIIGVIGEETMKAVSPVNLRVCKTMKEGKARDASCEDSESRPLGSIKTGSPVMAVTMALRAAWLVERTGAKPDFDKVVVMAQMPRAQAEEMGVQIAASLKRTTCSDLRYTKSGDDDLCTDNAADARHIDLILSEAQSRDASPYLELTYARRDLIPVITPERAGDMNSLGTDLIEPLSTATMTEDKSVAFARRTLKNSENRIHAGDNPDTAKTNFPSMADLFHLELEKDGPRHPSADLSNLENFWNGCAGQKACRESILTQFVLEQIHRSSHADVVLLEYRDLYFGPMLRGYEKYDICDEWVRAHANDLKDQLETAAYCRVRIALDRILWKGDYSERVVVNGSTLENMVKTAQLETESEQALIARDTVNEWLMTFGIVTQTPTNLSAASMGPATFVIPGAAFCTDARDSGTSKNCINGQRVSSDGAYLIATSDHLAEDDQVYKLLKGVEDKYHIRKKDFLTEEIADEIFRHDRAPASEKLVTAPDAYIGMTKVDEQQQKRPILQVDVSKWVAGFMARRPSKSNAELAADFSGVTDSRATAPSAQELDLEALARVTSGVGVNKVSERLKLGAQTDLEYDRAVTGNLTGTPSTVTYALNSLSAGGFFQYRLHGIVAPRLFLVAAPYQYQTQITGNVLNFKSGQIKVATPRSQGFNHRLGLRFEFGRSLSGSYLEGGPEYSDINDVLSGLKLPNGSVCRAVPNAPLSTCVANLTSSTGLVPLTETLHTGGLYWDAHLQRTLTKDKRLSLTLDTKGDAFIWPGATLATQSLYAFTTTEAVNFKVAGNLLFAPTYSQFFYENQGQPNHSLVTQTFSVVAKWYFARDAAVPFWRQLLFVGPTSMDQTKGARMH